MRILAWLTIVIASLQATAIIQVKPKTKSETLSKAILISHSLLATIMAIQILIK